MRGNSVKIWSKMAGAAALGMALAVSGAVAPSYAAANSITVADTTAGGGGTQQIATPWFNSGALSQSVMFRGLLRANADLNTVKPDLASSFKVSADGKKVDVTLKSGLKWSDGEAIGTDDVVWSMNTLLRVAQANGIFVNAFKQIVGSEAVSATNDATISGITVNGNVISIELKAPQNTFLPVLAQFMILPKHALAKVDPLKMATDKFWKDPVTSGPFMVGKLSQGNFITLVPNPNFEGAKPKITEINVVTSANLVNDAKSGKIDYFTTNDAETIAAMGAVSSFKGTEVNTPFYRYFIFNLTQANSPFKNIKARQALKYGIDWNGLVPILYRTGKVINSGVMAGMEYHLASIPKVAFNEAKAKKLLKEAKFDFSKTIRLRHYYAGQAEITFMTAIAQQMMDLGMKVEMLRFQADPTTELYTNRNYDVALKGLSAFSVAEWYGEYSNTATFEKIIGPQPKFAALNAKFATAQTDAQMKKALTDLQKLEQASLLKFPIHSLKQYVYVSKNITGTGKFGNPLYIYDNSFANWVAR